MPTGWQRSFVTSVRHNRQIGMQVDLERAIQQGIITKDMDIKEIARRYEMSQAKVRRMLNGQGV